MTGDELARALQAYANTRGISLRRATDLYAVRCVLARLQRLDEGRDFRLKGGMLVTALMGEELRTTRDADLLAPGTPSQERMRDLFGRAAQEDVADGLEVRLPFRSKRARKHTDGYDGVGLSTSCTVAGILPGSIKLDLGFGDASVPDGGRIILPPLFGGMSPVEVGAYAPEAMLAEKAECLLSNFPASIRQRLKDFFDICVVTANLNRPLEGTVLCSSFAAVFEQRGTPYDDVEALDLMQADLPDDPGMLREWDEFRQRSGASEITLAEAIAQTRVFVEPLLVALGKGETHSAVWIPGQGWVQ